MISMMTSVVAATKISIAPAVPACTIAASETIPPFGAPRVIVPGLGCPVAQVVKDATGPGATMAMFNE